jgi:hypothetical protein
MADSTATTNNLQITKDRVKSWAACSGGYRWFLGKFPEGTEFVPVYRALIADKRVDDANWLVGKLFDELDTTTRVKQTAIISGADAVAIAAPDGTRTQWLVVKQKGLIATESQTLTVALEGRADAPSSQGYPVPGALRLKSTGIDGHVQLDRLLLRDDPFASLPRLFRFVVGLALNLRPRRVWASSPFALSFPPDQASGDHAPQHLRGTGVTAVTFLNPLPAF